MFDLLLVSCLLSICAIFCLSVILVPTLAPDKPGLIGTASLIIAMLVGGSRLAPQADLMGAIFVVVTLALVPSVVIARSFRRIDMIAILFHRDFGMQGATLSGLKNEIATAVITALLLILSVLAHDAFLDAPSIFMVSAIMIVFLANPFVRYALSRLWQQPVKSVLLDRFQQPTIVASSARPDLVVVYLEGVDRRFHDEKVFGDITARLRRYEAEGISFSRVGQIAGTGWSLAGMVATLSGLPVAPRGLNFQKRLEDVEVFMPNQKFLADVLQEKGYESHYVVGGDTEFGGIGPMYRTHQICQMTGIDAMKASFPADDVSAATAGWFVDDQMVLDAAREIHKSLLKKEQPYALIVETIGPHGPRGTISRKWTKSGKTENCDIPTSVSCLLDEVEEFLHDVRKAQASRRELRIVLLSDHLNHSPHLPKAGVEFEGYNTVIFWGAHDRRGEVVDKAGSMVDVFPTLLEWLGWSSGPVAAGIGRSLLSHPPTLVEEFGIPVVDRMITSDAAFANRIWSTPPRLAEVQATA